MHTAVMERSSVMTLRNLAKPTVDLREIVKETHTPGAFGNDLIMICCPFHHEKTESMAIYYDHYHCYGKCGAHGTVYDWLSKIRHMSDLEIEAYLKNFTVPTEKTFHATTAPSNKPISKHMIKLIRYAAANLYLQIKHDQLPECHVLHQRGFYKDKEQALRFVREHKIGLFDQQLTQQLSVPLKWMNRLSIPYLGYGSEIMWMNSRRLGEGDTPKYLNIGGSAHPYHIVGQSMALRRKKLIIAEGELDTLSILEVLGDQFPVVGVAGGSITSANNLRFFQSLIDQGVTLHTLFDGDDAGHNHFVKLKKRLKTPALFEHQLLSPTGKPYEGDINDAYVAFSPKVFATIIFNSLEK